MQEAKKSTNFIFILKIAIVCAFLCIPKFSFSLDTETDFLTAHKKAEIQSVILKFGGSQEHKNLKKNFFQHFDDAIINSEINLAYSAPQEYIVYKTPVLHFCQTIKSISARGPPLYS